MKKSLRCCFVALLAAGVAGCASNPKPYEARRDESLAMTVARASDLVGLRDLDRPDEAQGGVSKSLVREASSSLPGAAALGGLSALRPPPGFGPGGAGFMTFASFFLSGPGAATVSEQSHLLAWTPKEFGPDKIAVQQRLNALVARELEASLNDVRLGDGYRIEKVVKQEQVFRPGKRLVPEGYVSDHVYFNVKGGECDQPKVRCVYSITASVPPIEGFAPEALGGGPAWAWTRNEGLIGVLPTMKDSRSRHAVYKARFPDIEVYRRLSERLPEWAFLYIAPNRVGYWNEDRRGFELIPFPFVLNKGRALHFVIGDRG